jgi:hypothetical protein
LATNADIEEYYRHFQFNKQPVQIINILTVLFLFNIITPVDIVANPVRKIIPGKKISKKESRAKNKIPFRDKSS